jgi:uncharacterized membrane protein YgcG
MKTGVDKGKVSPLDLDLRIRDRHLASGVLDHKAVERYIAELPDLEVQAETMQIEQPALGRALQEVARGGGGGGGGASGATPGVSSGTTGAGGSTGGSGSTNQGTGAA